MEESTNRILGAPFFRVLCERAGSRRARSQRFFLRWVPLHLETAADGTNMKTCSATTKQRKRLRKNFEIGVPSLKELGFTVCGKSLDSYHGVPSGIPQVAEGIVQRLRKNAARTRNIEPPAAEQPRRTPCSKTYGTAGKPYPFKRTTPCASSATSKAVGRRDATNHLRRAKENP